MEKFDRRAFLRIAGTTGAAAFLLGQTGCKSGFSRALAAEDEFKPRVPRVKGGDVFACKGEDPAAITRAAIESAGGMSKYVKKGDLVVIKPNIGFDRRPEQAATTNPLLVAALIKMCLKSGASRVRVMDRPCNDTRRCYNHSGIAKAAEDAGAKVVFMNDSDFVEVKIPGAKVLKSWPVYRDFVEADVFINVPIVKHHGQTGVTLGMKNLMGCAGGQRGAWHVGQLGQRIADINTAIRPDLVVIDAYRILQDHGPTGGSLKDVREVHTVAVSSDIVAADAYGAKLFGSAPADVDYIKIAHEMGLGEMDLKKIKIKEEKV